MICMILTVLLFVPLLRCLNNGNRCVFGGFGDSCAGFIVGLWNIFIVGYLLLKLRLNIKHVSE
jgi:hypothetical protein